MELTLEELEALEPGSYTLLDLRSEQETGLRHHSRLRSGQRRRPAGGAAHRPGGTDFHRFPSGSGNR